MYFWTWRTEEVLNMVEWMRRFNHPKQRIQFTGFDMQFYEGAVNELLDAFKGNEEVSNSILYLTKMLDKIKTRAQYNKGMPTVGENEKKEIDSILSFLKICIETLPNKDWLQQNRVIIQQYLENNGGFWRDKCMADNFMWIKEHNPNSKLVIWAHNAHIQKTGQMMGSILAQKLSDDYTTFGFTFYDGSFTAAGSNGLTSYNAVKAYRGTLEYLLEQIKEPIFILDMKKIKSDKNKNTEWLLQRMAYRDVGSIGGTLNEFDGGKIADDFDYLIFIKTSTPSTLLPKQQ
jgi:erythromycin esterase